MDLVSVAYVTRQHSALLNMAPGCASGHLMPYVVSLPQSLFVALQRSAMSLVTQAMVPSLLAQSRALCPQALLVGGEPDWCEFFSVDFALVLEEGRLSHRLIELQGFPSLYAFCHLMEASLDSAQPGLAPLPVRRQALQSLVLGEASTPEAVVMLDESPLEQASGFCFELMAKHTGVQPLALDALYRRGKQLFYRRSGFHHQEVRVERIYNRLIVKSAAMARRCRALFQGADVSFAGHPDWYYLLAKQALPLLDDPSILPCELVTLPGAPLVAGRVLKPLFGHGGDGVILNPEGLTDVQLPRGLALSQQRIDYAPCVIVDDGSALALEVRVLCLWPKGSQSPQVSALMGRTSAGAMINATRQSHPSAGACLVTGPLESQPGTD